MSDTDQVPGNKLQSEPIPTSQQDPSQPTPTTATGVSTNPAVGGQPSVNTATPITAPTPADVTPAASTDVVNDTQMPQVDTSVSSVETTPTGSMGSTATGQSTPALPNADAVEAQSNQLGADLVASGAVASTSFPTDPTQENTNDQASQSAPADPASSGQTASAPQSGQGSTDSQAGSSQDSGSAAPQDASAQTSGDTSSAGQTPDAGGAAAPGGPDVGQSPSVQGADGQGNGDGQGAQSAASQSAGDTGSAPVQGQVAADPSVGSYSGVAVHGEDPVVVAAVTGATVPQPTLSQPSQESQDVQGTDSGNSAAPQPVSGNNPGGTDVSNPPDSGSAPAGQSSPSNQGDAGAGSAGGGDPATSGVQSGTSGPDVGAVGGAASPVGQTTDSANAGTGANNGVGGDQVAQQSPGGNVASVDTPPTPSDAANLINSTSGSTDMSSTSNNPQVPTDTPADSGSSTPPPAVTTNPTPDATVSPNSPDVAATTDSNAPPNAPTPPVASTTDPASPAPVAPTDNVSQAPQTPSEPTTTTMTPNPADTSNNAPANAATGTSDASSTAAPAPAAQVIDTSGAATAATPAAAPAVSTDSSAAPATAPAAAPAADTTSTSAAAPAAPEATSGPTGISNVDQILDGIPAALLVPILAIKNYMTNMAPRKPTDPKTGAEHQVTLFRAMQQIINNENEHFEKLFTAMLRMFEHGNDQAFSDTHVFRFMEHVKLNSDEIKGYQKLVNLVKVMGPVDGRSEAARQVNVSESLTHGVTEGGRNRILSYFGH